MTLFSVRKTHLRHIIQHDRLREKRASIVHLLYIIILDDLRLKCVKKRHAQELTEANCITRLSRAKKLFSKFPESAVDLIFFTDEKVFTVAPPVNLQNDRGVYRVGR